MIQGGYLPDATQHNLMRADRPASAGNPSPSWP
jgi:hypothetical protein